LGRSKAALFRAPHANVVCKRDQNMSNENKIFAFVLMPSDSAFDDIYKLGIKETASQLDIFAERVDEQIFQEGILDRIYRQIELADIIIADMSGQNPNVFYEVGYAHHEKRDDLKYLNKLT
jgi:hypothetical protein